MGWPVIAGIVIAVVTGLVMTAWRPGGLFGVAVRVMARALAAFGCAVILGIVFHVWDHLQSSTLCWLVSLTSAGFAIAATVLESIGRTPPARRSVPGRVALVAVVLTTGLVLVAWRSAVWMDEHWKVDKALPAETRNALSTATEFTLLSLNPSRDEVEAPHGRFHDYPIIGSTPIPPGAEREALVAALVRGVAEHGDMMGLCFDPRHGIRARLGNNQIDLVICFTCLTTNIVEGANSRYFYHSSSPRPVFDRALTSRAIPIAK